MLRACQPASIGLRVCVLPDYDSRAVAGGGHDNMQPNRQRYRCTTCIGRFEDLTSTALAGHHQPPRAWVPCLWYMPLNHSNQPRAVQHKENWVAAGANVRLASCNGPSASAQRAVVRDKQRQPEQSQQA